MNDGTETLKARLNKHAFEIAALEDRHRKGVKRWKSLCSTATVLAVGLFILLVRSGTDTGWRTDTPPANQRIQMVVYVYKGADGIWKSYAEGHPVEPVTSATGQMLWHP